MDIDAVDVGRVHSVAIDDHSFASAPTADVLACKRRRDRRPMSMDVFDSVTDMLEDEIINNMAGSSGSALFVGRRAEFGVRGGGRDGKNAGCLQPDCAGECFLVTALSAQPCQWLRCNASSQRRQRSSSARKQSARAVATAHAHASAADSDLQPRNRQPAQALAIGVQGPGQLEQKGGLQPQGAIPRS
eukprot:2465128-Alexandrium_andersonii.AAC.1